MSKRQLTLLETSYGGQVLRRGAWLLVLDAEGGKARWPADRTAGLLAALESALRSGVTPGEQGGRNENGAERDDLAAPGKPTVRSQSMGQTPVKVKVSAGARARTAGGGAL